MSAYRKPRRGDWTKSLFVIGFYVAAIAVSSFLLLPLYWYLWLALVTAGLAVIVLWHAKSTAYRCPKCGNTFEISFLTDFFSPHGITKEGGGWKYLKCPACSNRSKMETLLKTKINSNSILTKNS